MRAAIVAISFAGLVGAGEPPAGEIDAAVKRGLRWLRSEQKADGSFGTNAGETALALMTLRHAGVPPSDRACERAARRLERVLPDGTVYGAALGTMALLAQSPEKHARKIRKLVDQLVRGQCVNGQWTYAYRRTARKKAGDNSNTQIAALALAVAHVRRVVVDDAPLALCGKFFRESQNEDGGFGYAAKQRRRSYGSMTAGGAMALALADAAKRGVAFGHASVARDPAVARALAWLGREFDPARNRGAAAAFGNAKAKRGDDFWKHYWLWSLERACAAAGVEKIAGRDWYREGARHLLDTQHKRGLWRGPERSLQATCFAILFFSRSTRVCLTPRPRDIVPTSGG